MCCGHGRGGGWPMAIGIWQDHGAQGREYGFTSHGGFPAASTATRYTIQAVSMDRFVHVTSCAVGRSRPGAWPTIKIRG
eukprot:3826788-Prymnesium_polylepis.1